MPMKYKYPIHIKELTSLQEELSAKDRQRNPSSLNILPFRFLLFNEPDKNQSGLIPFIVPSGTMFRQRCIEGM